LGKLRKGKAVAQIAVLDESKDTIPKRRGNHLDLSKNWVGGGKVERVEKKIKRS